MATTAQTAANETITYAMLVIFTVTPSRDEHLQDGQAIRDEAQKLAREA